MREKLLIIKARLSHYLRRIIGYKSLLVGMRIQTDHSSPLFADDSAKHIHHVQQENDKKIKEMNEKLSKTLRRIEEVKKRMVNSHSLDPDKKTGNDQKPFNIVRKTYLNRMSSRKLNEFENIHEFIKFNRMKAITDEEVQNCDWDVVFRKLCE